MPIDDAFLPFKVFLNLRRISSRDEDWASYSMARTFSSTACESTSRSITISDISNTLGKVSEANSSSSNPGRYKMLTVIIIASTRLRKDLNRLGNTLIILPPGIRYEAISPFQQSQKHTDSDSPPVKNAQAILLDVEFSYDKKTEHTIIITYQEYSTPMTHHSSTC